MNLEFILNEDFIAINLLTRNIQINKDYDIEIYQDIRRKFERELKELLAIDQGRYFEKMNEGITKLIEYFKTTDYFKSKFQDTEKYLSDIQIYWLEKKSEIEEFLKKTLRIDININQKIFIVNPYSQVGYNYTGVVAWGHFRGIEDKNYNIVYLVHETLHTLIPYNEEIYGILTHTVIELTADNDLYKFLDDNDHSDEGHDFNKEMKAKILSAWEEYKNSDVMNVFEFLEQENKKLDEKQILK